MKSEKMDKTRFFSYMIENYKKHKLMGPTSFIEGFVNRNIICKLGLQEHMGVCWEKGAGWRLQLSNRHEYLVNDFECTQVNEMGNAKLAKFIEDELVGYMRKQFGLRYVIARNKYFISKDKQIQK